MYVLKGRVIDGNGGEPLEKGIVEVTDNKITAVCNEWEYTVPEGAEVIEVENGTIMPGFIDQHVHMGVGDNYYKIFERHAYHAVCQVLRDMKQILNAGFTSIREVGGLSNYLKAPWEEGLIDGPRICSSGKAIAQSGGHWDYIKDYPIEFTLHPDRNVNSEICDGVDNVRRTVRMHFREHCDFIKIMGGPGISCQGNKIFTREFSDSELRAFVEEAENQGSYVAIHAHAAIAINAALRCGVRSIEHATLMDDESIELMLKNNAWIVPTLATSYMSWQHIDEREPWVKEKMSAIEGPKEENLRKAYERTLQVGSSSQSKMSQQDYELYGTYIPFSMAICHTINHKSGVDHTTYAHTGAMVNLYARGQGADKFRGVYDNTEIFHKLAELTDVQ